MGAETEHLKIPEFPVPKEKLEKLWQNAWKLIEKTVEHPTDERKFIVKESRLIEIESGWDSDFLDRIVIRSRDLPVPGGDRPWIPRLLRLETEVVVNNPGSLGSVEGYDKESYDFYGDTSWDQIDSIDYAITQLLDFQYLPSSR